MQYLCINEDPSGVIYMILTEKNFSKPAGFACLERLRKDFSKFFNEDRTKKAKTYELNDEFRGTLERAYVKN